MNAPEPCMCGAVDCPQCYPQPSPEIDPDTWLEARAAREEANETPIY